MRRGPVCGEEEVVDAVRTVSRATRLRFALAHAACPVPLTPLASTGLAARAGCTCLIFRAETGPGAHLVGLPSPFGPSGRR
jgi:hypothetical protein